SDETVGPRDEVAAAVNDAIHVDEIAVHASCLSEPLGVSKGIASVARERPAGGERAPPGQARKGEPSRALPRCRASDVPTCVAGEADHAGSRLRSAVRTGSYRWFSFQREVPERNPAIPALPTKLATVTGNGRAGGVSCRSRGSSLDRMVY